MQRERDGDRVTEQELEGDRRWSEGRNARSYTWRERGRWIPGRETGSEKTQHKSLRGSWRTENRRETEPGLSGTGAR